MAPTVALVSRPLHAASVTREPDGERVVDVVEKESGASRERIRPEATFVYDLGLD